MLVIPAPGEPARLPFWRRGDGVDGPPNWAPPSARSPVRGGPAGPAGSSTRVAAHGFDDYATENLWRLLDDQRTSTGTVPSDTTLLVERFRDELGDWRVILHSPPYGLRVHGAWALMIGKRLYDRYGIDEKPTASDDGIIVRLPDTDENPPGADIFVFDADEVAALVTAGGRRLGAVRLPVPRMRGPALLLPRRHPGKRSPLWHQRQRAAQLLDVARRHPDFPIVLGDRAGMPAGRVRRARPDRPDVPHRLAPGAGARSADRAAVAVRGPLLFGYVGAFMYEGDSPLAERRAAALSLDTALLAELDGPGRAARAAGCRRGVRHREATAAPESRAAARDAEAVADLLRCWAR